MTIQKMSSLVLFTALIVSGAACGTKEADPEHHVTGQGQVSYSAEGALVRTDSNDPSLPYESYAASSAAACYIVNAVAQCTWDSNNKVCTGLGTYAKCGHH